MLRNHLTVAVRNFLRHPIYSTINVSGLVLGLMCSIFIFLWVLDEINYNTYHPDNDRVFKVMINRSFVNEGSTSTDQWTDGRLAERLKAEIPEIEQTARMSWSDLKIFKYGNYSGYEPGDYADKSIFEAMNLTLVEGNVHHALPDNNSVAISKKLATKLFKHEHALGKTVTISGASATVTSVFEDLPLNTTETFEFILPFELYILKELKTLENYDGAGWLSTIVKLDQKEHKDLAEKRLQSLSTRMKIRLIPTSPLPFFTLCWTGTCTTITKMANLPVDASVMSWPLVWWPSLSWSSPASIS